MVSVTENGTTKVAAGRRRLPEGKRPIEHGGLSTNGTFNFGIPSKQGAQNFVEQFHGKASWRMKIIEFLHKPAVSWTLMGLLLLDVVILFVELFMLTHYPLCVTIERDCISCCPSEVALDNETEHIAERFLSGDVEDHHSNVCEAGLEASYGTGGCDVHKWQTIHNVETGLYAVTIMILSTFFVELTMEMIALRPGIFFRQFFFALDYVIVTVSLILELALHSVEDESLAAFLGLLIFARIWRFVRIGHGIAEVTSEYTHQKYDLVLEYTAALEEAATKSGVEMPECPEMVRQALLEQSSSHSHHNSE